eukprot:8340807-Prorocentrum_lima.AAC.1
MPRLIKNSTLADLQGYTPTPSHRLLQSTSPLRLQTATYSPPRKTTTPLNTTTYPSLAPSPCESRSTGVGV